MKTFEPYSEWRDPYTSVNQLEGQFHSAIQLRFNLPADWRPSQMSLNPLTSSRRGRSTITEDPFSPHSDTDEFRGASRGGEVRVEADPYIGTIAIASNPSQLILHGPMSIEQLAHILVAGDHDFLVRLEAQLQLKGFSTEAASRFRGFFESIGGYSQSLPPVVGSRPIRTSHIQGRTADRGGVESFLQRARRLGNAGHIDQALDLIYESVDQLLRGSHFDELDSLLKALAVESYSADLLLAILTSSFPAKSWLPSRASLFAQVQEFLRSQGEDAEDLLVGLGA